MCPPPLAAMAQMAILGQDTLLSKLEVDYKINKNERKYYGTSYETLNTILENIIEKNSDDFIKNSSFKVRPGYGPDKFYLDKANQDYESSLENLIHHILFEEELYNHFLNERQMGNCKNVIENEPDSIYRPDLEDEVISDEEYELEEKASEY